jgi:hypothetical protein
VREVVTPGRAAGRDALKLGKAEGDPVCAESVSLQCSQQAWLVSPVRSTDLLTKDADHVWCALTADRPFAAFGAMYFSDSAAGQNAVTAINLVAVSR